jgi:hypothetical protein
MALSNRLGYLLSVPHCRQLFTIRQSARLVRLGKPRAAAAAPRVGLGRFARRPVHRSAPVLACACDANGTHAIRFPRPRPLCCETHEAARTNIMQ